MNKMADSLCFKNNVCFERKIKTNCNGQVVTDGEFCQKLPTLKTVLRLTKEAMHHIYVAEKIPSTLLLSKS